MPPLLWICRDHAIFAGWQEPVSGLFRKLYTGKTVGGIPGLIIRFAGNLPVPVSVYPARQVASLESILPGFVFYSNNLKSNDSRTIKGRSI